MARCRKVIHDIDPLPDTHERRGLCYVALKYFYPGMSEKPVGSRSISYEAPAVMAFFKKTAQQMPAYEPCSPGNQNIHARK